MGNGLQKAFLEKQIKSEQKVSNEPKDQTRGEQKPTNEPTQQKARTNEPKQQTKVEQKATNEPTEQKARTTNEPKQKTKIEQKATNQPTKQKVPTTNESKEQAKIEQKASNEPTKQKGPANEPQERNEKCGSAKNQALLFDELHGHSLSVFPGYVTGLGATLTHNLAKHANMSHTASIDIFNDYKEKNYLLNVNWFGCKECHCPSGREKVAKHIDRLKATASLNPFEYIPNSHTINLKNIALQYLTENFTTGVWTRNLFIGDTQAITSLSNPHDIAQNCNHFGVDFTWAVKPSIVLGIRGSHSGFDNGYARIDKSNCISVAARVAIPSNATVFSTRIGEGSIDLHISTNLVPQLQVAIAVNSSLKNTVKNTVNYGFKLTLPDEKSTLCLSVDNHWKVAASIRKQITSYPIAIMATSAFIPTADNRYDRKFGFGIEVNL